MNNNLNDQKYHNYQKNKVFKYIYVVLSIAVIILEILALFRVISMLWGLVIFIIIYLLKKFLLK